MKNTSNKPSQNSNSPRSASKVASRSDDVQGLRDLFEDELKDIYWAEKTLTKSIPKMIKNASSHELTEALTNHLDETIEQVSRLEEVFKLIGAKALAIKCEAMEGLIVEAGEIMDGIEKGVVRDAGIILAGQKIEHYEIATYGTLAAFARTLGEDEAADLLEETLSEEKEANDNLARIAESISIEASEEGGDEEESETPTFSRTKRKW